MYLVRTEGFEPSHHTAPPPQDGVSTNSTTFAKNQLAWFKKAKF